MQAVIAKFGYKIDLRSKDDISQALNSLMSDVEWKKRTKFSRYFSHSER